MSMLAGELRPDPPGTASVVAGISVVRDAERVKHHIAYMSQRFAAHCTGT
jgi:ABC-type multidrug transport system ATPase subunit